ncbi:MAG: hypothetical protein ACK4MQ_10245 [Hyphomonas sp.]
MIRTIVGAALFVLCAACANSLASRPSGQAAVCAPYNGAAPVAESASSHVVILGEALHGTSESPEALFGLACLLSARRVPVLVGIEAERTFSSELDAFLTHRDAEKLRAATPQMWAVHDGRSSQATLLLLQNLGQLRAAGADVSIFAFDAVWPADAREDEDWGTVTRDAKMAETVDAAVRDFPGAVILLTGGFHARKQAFSFAGTRFVPMATGITARPVLSYEMRHAGGTGWIMGEVDGQPVEGAVSLMNLLPEGVPVRTFVPGHPAGSEDWDGAYYTGPITASPPAFPAGLPP